MSTTPVFDRVFASLNPYASMPEFTERFTPEVARQQGFRAGEDKMLETVLKMISRIDRPTKQIKDLRDALLDLDLE